MANIKSQIKRIRTNEAARERNKSVRSALKTHIRKFNEAVASGDFEAAEQVRRVAGRALDKAASAGVIHENNAANNKSGMAIALAKAIAAPPMPEEAKKAAKKAAAKKAAARKAPAKAEAPPADAPTEDKPKRMAKAAAKIAERVKAPAKKTSEKKAPAKKAAAKAEEAPAEEKPKRASAKKKTDAAHEPTEA